MIQRLVLVFAVLCFGTVVAGCAQAEEAAQNVTRQAQDAATRAATDAVKGELCRMVSDAKLSEDERTTLRAAIDTAERAGADPSLIDLARQAEQSSGSLTPDQMKAVQQQCAPTTTSTTAAG